MLLGGEEQDNASPGHEVDVVDLVVLLEDAEHFGGGIALDGEAANSFVLAVELLEPPKAVVRIRGEVPAVPSCASMSDRGPQILHSLSYRSLRSLRGNGVNVYISQGEREERC